MNSRFGFSHPVWLVGFRPFFILAMVYGAILPLLWAAIFSGALPFPNGGLSSLQWHAHEMFFGFGWAVLGGFLLTASKNWVKIRGLHGFPLAFAVLLWLIERIAIYAFLPQVTQPPLMLAILLSPSVIYVVCYVVWCLVRYRGQDSFADNYFFIVSLPILIAAKALLLSTENFNAGWLMTLGLFRIAFVMMLERTTTQFMKNAMKVELPRHRLLDLPIKVLAVLSVFEAFWPTPIAAALLAAFALFLLVRFFLWSPLVAIKRFEIGLMYVGYFGLAVHLLLEALRITGHLTVVGDVATHTFTFVTMGIIIPGMLIRICQGHTGRKLEFTRSDRTAIWTMGVASVFRLIVPQVWPARYLLWIDLSALGWAICFALLGWRLIPFLLQPRIDGKEH